MQWRYWPVVLLPSFPGIKRLGGRRDLEDVHYSKFSACLLEPTTVIETVFPLYERGVLPLDEEGMIELNI